jgi:hypothetical protein
MRGGGAAELDLTAANVRLLFARNLLPLRRWPLSAACVPDAGGHGAPPSMTAFDRACVKTPTRFDTDLFCSLFRALRPLGSETIAKNFALRDCLQKFAGFSHGLDPKRKDRR